MTTFKPRAAYTQAELEDLYPASLELQQVQILLRHGERTPVNARFRNAGLPAYWPYCGAAQQLRSAVLTAGDKWDHLSFTRKLETFNRVEGNDTSVLAAGPRGETQNICLPGELTDTGRRTTHALGTRLRRLYVDQLGFLPSTLDTGTHSQLYLRATPIPRALESVQQTFAGLYPATKRDPNLPPLAIVTRQASDETLFPNEGSCKRFNQLALAFGERTAKIWNDSPELRYVTSRIGKWMPPDSPQVKVDSHPRLSGVMDTINSTRAHGPETRLPSEFYDEKVIAHIDRIGVEEWFSGHNESVEYRRLGIGSLVGDITARIVERAWGSAAPAFIKENQVASGKNVQLGLSGCHDTTLAATLSALGAFKGEKWPPYTSHIAVELFRDVHATSSPPSSSASSSMPAIPPTTTSPQPTSPGLWERVFGPPAKIPGSSDSDASSAHTSRTPLSELPGPDKDKLEGFFVRLRYNDRPLTIPGCRGKGKHYKQDESLCTLAAFKEIADKITPRDWRKECGERLGESAFPAEVEEAGY